MDARRIIDIVNDFPSWKGNTYTLATIIAEAAVSYQKEADATLAEAQPPASTPEEVAAAIRAQ